MILLHMHGTFVSNFKPVGVLCKQLTNMFSIDGGQKQMTMIFPQFP